jgi:hypothetical protein
MQEIETGLRLTSEGKAISAPVSFMHFESPKGDVHIKAIDNANAFPTKIPKAGSSVTRNQYKWKELPTTPTSLDFAKQFQRKRPLFQKILTSRAPTVQFLE